MVAVALSPFTSARERRLWAWTLAVVFDETIQLVLPSRVFDPINMLFNVLAAVMAVAASSALRWARERNSRGLAQHASS